MKFPKVHIQIKTVLWLLLAMFIGFGVQPVLAKPNAMHIMEGFLPAEWCIFWFAVSIPFWVIGFIQIKRIFVQKPDSRLLLGLAGAFTFVLSALKIPSVTG